MEEHLKIKCENLYEHLIVIKRYCKEQWSHLILPFLPEHGLEHSEKMIQFLKEITPMINPPLSNDEIYILLSAIYIHDLGLQDYEPLIREGLVRKPFSMPYNNQDVKIIIDEHRRIIPQIVDKIIWGKKTKHQLPYANLIKIVAKEHKKSGDKYKECIRTMGGEIIRLKMLIALIQCCDALHISSDRVKMKMSHIDIIPFESKKFWWEMYYIREVVVDQKTKRIRFHYVIPPKFQDYMDMFVDFSERRFKRHPGDAMDILWDHGVHLQVGASVPWVILDDEKEMMPEEIINDIRKYLHKSHKESMKQLEERIKIYAIEKGDIEPKMEIVFCLDGAPGKVNNDIIKFLKETFDTKWVENATIEKIEDDKSIIISDGNGKRISLKLIEEETKVSITIDEKNYIFRVIIIDGKRFVYK